MPIGRCSQEHPHNQIPSSCIPATSAATAVDLSGLDYSQTEIRVAAAFALSALPVGGNRAHRRRHR